MWWSVIAVDEVAWTWNYMISAIITVAIAVKRANPAKWKIKPIGEWTIEAVTPRVMREKSAIKPLSPRKSKAESIYFQSKVQCHRTWSMRLTKQRLAKVFKAIAHIVSQGSYETRHKKGNKDGPQTWLCGYIWSRWLNVWQESNIFRSKEARRFQSQNLQ